MTRAIRRAILLSAFLLAWEGLHRAGLADPIIFGAPSLILKAGYEDGGTFLSAFQLTLGEIAAAVTIAWLLGVGLGVVLGASERLARVSAPILSALIAIPLVILYPLMIAWAGLGPTSKVIFGVLSGVFPIALNALSGVRGLDPGYVRMARAMGCTKTQLLFQVLAPLALPAIVSGLRLGTALIIIAVVLSEMLGATDGLGFWISYHRALFNTGHVYLGILLALSAAMLTNLALAAVEAKLGRRG